MRIAILGAGNVGLTLGRGWAAAGHSIVYGSREPREAPHQGAVVRTFAESVRDADAAVLTVPWSAVPAVLDAAGDFGGCPLLDVTNPIGQGLTLTHGHDESGAEVVASLAKNARVVKAFNTTGLENMANPRYGDDRAFMPIAGDDDVAVELGLTLARDLGFDAHALRALRHARELEPLAMLWISMALVWGHGRNFAFALTRRGGATRIAPTRAASPTVITVVGTGNIGGALARGWLDAGHTVRLATRDPEREDVRALVSRGASAHSLRDAARGAEVIALATPYAAAVDVLRELGGADGKIVVDCTNAIGKGFTLLHGHTSSSAEELAKALPGVRLVRSFNQQGAETLENPCYGPRRAVDFVAADDAEARAVVRTLASDIGLDAVDAGPLASARLLEPLTIAWVALSKVLGARDFAFTILRR